jgi:hypothetical protein
MKERGHFKTGLTTPDSTSPLVLQDENSPKIIQKINCYQATCDNGPEPVRYV